MKLATKNQEHTSHKKTKHYKKTKIILKWQNTTKHKSKNKSLKKKEWGPR